jgi:hypothetical protein
MRRSVAVVIIVAVAAAGVYFASRDTSETIVTVVETSASRIPTSSAEQSQPREPQRLTLEQLVVGSLSVAERAAIYQLAAQSDRAGLQSLVRKIAVYPATDARLFALEVLLARHVEIDARGAVRLAADLALEPQILAPLYRTWALSDADAALLELSALDNASVAVIAIEVLSVIGNDESGIARVLAALPQLSENSFRAEAVAAKAEEDPEDALEDLLQLPSSERYAAFARVASAWAKQDVHAAIEHAEGIADREVRRGFGAALLREWAKIDPDAMLDYVLELDEASQQEALDAGGLQAFASVEPARALAVAEKLDGNLAQMMRSSALMNLAGTDPLAALRYAENLGPGPEREQALSAAARGYAREDPEAALAWVRSLQPPSPGLLGTVITSLAREDPDRAIDLLFGISSLNEQMSVLQPLVRNRILSAERTGRIADRLAASPRQRPALQMLTNVWAEREPEAALSWLLANPERAPSSSFGHAAGGLARDNPDKAIAYMNRIPNEARDAWLSGLAVGYAQNDPQAAASWIVQHRGQPGYDEAAAQISAQSARYDPLGAAALVATIDMRAAPAGVGAAANVAAQWSRQNPRAAADWALDLNHDEARTRAVTAVAGQWSSKDAVGARAWALGLPPGAARDAALPSVISAHALENGVVEQTLLNAFSSDAAQQEGVSRVVTSIAQRDTLIAREIADTYLTDRALRERTDRALDQAQQVRIMPRGVYFPDF